jgi:inner membrane protein involved in colicin E2 resistance
VKIFRSVWIKTTIYALSVYKRSSLYLSKLLKAFKDCCIFTHTPYAFYGLSFGLLANEDLVSCFDCTDELVFESQYGITIICTKKEQLYIYIVGN